MFAILSDIHANLEALTAVLADIDRHGVERVVCLGDLVGYGPDPVACIDLVRERCAVVLKGNFDHWLGINIDDLNPLVVQSIRWTRSQLDSPTESRDVRDQRWAYLFELPPHIPRG